MSSTHAGVQVELESDAANCSSHAKMGYQRYFRVGEMWRCVLPARQRKCDFKLLILFPVKSKGVLSHWQCLEVPFVSLVVCAT